MIELGEPLDDVAAKWRAKLVETVRPHAEAGIPLLLSGGVDSATLLCACLELGHRPKCYGYRLLVPGDASAAYSADFSYGKRMAISAGCRWKGIFIERTFERLEADVREVISMLRTSRKTSVQCAQPIMHLARAVAEDGFDRALVGTGAVVLDDRTVMTIRGREGEEAARKYREEKLEDRHLDCGTGRMHEMARLCGVTLEEPYSDEPIRSHALALDITELNRGPRGYGQKGIAVRAYPGFWMRSKRYRRNSPLQVNSGLREWHDEQLLRSPLNPDRSQRVVAIYNRLLKELNEPNLLDPADD